jgi:hypothetical protein
MSALAERLYAVIGAHPGAAMTTLAADLGASPRELKPTGTGGLPHPRCAATSCAVSGASSTPFRRR